MTPADFARASEDFATWAGRKAGDWAFIAFKVGFVLGLAAGALLVLVLS